MRNSINLILILAGFVLLVVGCAPKSSTSTSNATKTNVAPTTTPQTNVLVDLPQLANKTSQEVESLLGKSLRTVKITDTPDEMPGEFRNYSIGSMSDALQVRFHKDKAVAFVLTLPKDNQVATAKELANLAGIDVDTGREASPYARKWSGEFNGVDFGEITALKSKVDDYYNLSVKLR